MLIFRKILIISHLKNKTMITRIGKYAFKNIFRNTFLSISSVLVLTLLMFFINILLVVHNISFKLIDSVNEKLTISLYLDDEYTKNDKEVIDLMNDIADASSSVEILYKDKDDVLEDVRKKDPQLVQILERTNPLPATIELSWISINDYNNIDYLIQGKSFILGDSKSGTSTWEIQEWDDLHFSNYDSQYNNITEVTAILTTLQVVLYIIIGVFLFSIWIIIYSIIGNFIYYYRDEIYITRLVWWSKMFIYGPFSLQWIIYSVVSFILSMALFLLVIKNANYILPWNYSLNFLLGDSTLIFALEFLVFVLIWWVSGLISSRKYLK